jgi:hypothetical protein
VTQEKNIVVRGGEKWMVVIDDQGVAMEKVEGKAAREN